MGASQRRRGADIEREIKRLHLDLGVHAERVPLSGASRYQNNGADVDIYIFGKDEAPLVCEVKARRGGAGFVTLERWLGENDLLFMRRNNSDPIVAMPWRIWAALLEKFPR